MTREVRKAGGVYKTPSRIGGESMARQEFKERCDVRNIVNTYRVTGQLSHVTQRQPAYGDFSEFVDFQHAQEVVSQVNQDFAQLPASVRRAAEGNAERFLEMLTTVEGVQELEEAGCVFEGREEHSEALAAPPQPPAAAGDPEGKAPDGE